MRWSVCRARCSANAARIAPAEGRLRILSWNVNGLRACAKKGFADWLAAAGAEIVGLQEVRARAADLPVTLARPEGWHSHLVAAERPGYSGAALFARREPDALDTSLDEARFDDEGRLQIARFGRLVVANVYFPNGNGKQRDNSRVPFKLDFYRALFERLDRLRRSGRRALVMAIQHRTARSTCAPARQRKDERLLPEERAEFDRWCAPLATRSAFEAPVSWWSQRLACAPATSALRIDYVLASPSALPFVRAAFLQPHVQGSDHCPVGVDLDAAILR